MVNVINSFSCRGWFPESKEMIYNYLSEKGVPEHLKHKGVPILTQFTGLWDKDKHTIYAGDLFEVAGNKIYEIKYCSGGVSNHEWYGGMFVMWLDEETFFPFDEYAMANGKVIGNIYQNPDLIPLPSQTFNYLERSVPKDIKIGYKHRDTSDDLMNNLE